MSEPHWTELPEEKAEYARLRGLLNYTTPLGRTLLSAKESQEKKIAEMHFTPMPCWLCGTPNTVYFAAGTFRLDRDPSKRDYCCIRCGISLSHTVPFLDTRPWYWGRPSTITPSDVVAACSTWQQAINEEARRDEPTPPTV